MKKTTHLKSNSSREHTEKLDNFLIDCLKDSYWAENHFLKQLYKIQKSSTTTQLKDAIESCISSTKDQISSIENAFEDLDIKTQSKKCEAMEGLIQECATIIGETDSGSYTRDVALVVATQKILHYGIATYGGLTEISNVLEIEDVSQVLADVLSEKKNLDKILTKVARNINKEAASETNTDTNKELVERF